MKKKFSLPLLGWILIIGIMVVTYFDFLYIIQSIKLLDSSSDGDAMVIFLKLLLFLSVLKVLSLGLIIKGKRIGVWCLGIVFITSVLIMAADSQERAAFIGLIGLITFLYFKYALASSENYDSLPNS